MKKSSAPIASEKKPAKPEVGPEVRPDVLPGRKPAPAPRQTKRAAAPRQPKKSLDKFFKAGKHFHCRFCGEVLGTFRFGRVLRNENFQQALAALASGRGYGFNGCKQCLTEKLPLSEVQEAFMADPARPKNMTDEVVAFKLVDIKPVSKDLD